jgi:glyoxylase-like metal-dependent hydrolase (beta-lactamase superfamily II)
MTIFNKNVFHNSVVSTLLPLVAFGLSLSACSPSNEDAAKINVPATEPVSTQDSAFPYSFEKVSNNTWVMHGPLELPNPQNKGFMNNPGLIKTSAGLVVIDPGSTVQVGEHVISEIKKIDTQPIVAVFNTHIHGDHWLANQAIKAIYPDVKIYGHPEMLVEIEQGEGDSWVQTMETMTEGASKGTMVVAPNNTVDNSDIIKIGDTSFKIHHYGIAHTKTDIMIEVVENNTVFLGDNVLAKRMPRMSDGTFQGSISTINTVLESNAKTYVPGHGQTGDNAMVLDYLNYITLVYNAAQQAFEEDLDSSDVITITQISTAAYKDWAGYADQIGPQGAQAYAEVEEAEF